MRNEEPSADPSEDGGRPSRLVTDAVHKHNLIVEMLFCLLNGFSLGMLLLASPVIVLTALGGDKLHITLIACAFPCGAFLGPLWATLGRRWGMKRLVVLTTTGANLLMCSMYWVDSAAVFTAIVVAGQLLYSATRMGQSSIYRAAYVRHRLARALGIFTCCTFVTMVPTTMLAGWLTDHDHLPMSFQFLYPAAGLFGLLACRFYLCLRAPTLKSLTPEKVSLPRRMATRAAGTGPGQGISLLSGGVLPQRVRVLSLQPHYPLPRLRMAWLRRQAARLVDAGRADAQPRRDLAVLGPLDGPHRHRPGAVADLRDHDAVPVQLLRGAGCGTADPGLRRECSSRPVGRGRTGHVGDGLGPLRAAIGGRAGL